MPGGIVCDSDKTHIRNGLLDVKLRYCGSAGVNADSRLLEYREPLSDLNRIAAQAVPRF